MNTGNNIKVGQSKNIFSAIEKPELCCAMGRV